MTGAELFDRFVEKSVSTSEIAEMDHATLTEQIAEMWDPADEEAFGMTYSEVAAIILEYAQEDAHDLVAREDACGFCGERRQDWLAWQDDELTCGTCGYVFTPESADVWAGQDVHAARMGTVAWRAQSDYCAAERGASNGARGHQNRAGGQVYAVGR